MKNKTVRGQDLKDNIQESREMGEDYRASHQGQDQLKPMKPNHQEGSAKRKDKEKR